VITVELALVLGRGSDRLRGRFQKEPFMSG